MIEDARNADFPETTAKTRDADIIIIGSGAAGITIALELMDSPLSILILEAGGAKFDSAGQDMYRAQSVTPDTHDQAHLYRRRGLGGSTTVWGGRCIPFDPIDFEKRPWINASGWPIPYEEVAAHYPRALAIAQAGLPQFSAGEAMPAEPAPLAYGIDHPDIIADRIERFSQPTDFGACYRKILAAAANIRLLTNAPVDRIITTGDGNRATGVRIRTADGKSRIFSAPHIVLATGGIETARLLLASRDVRPAGLGNERDLVGRYYQCHIEGELGQISFTGHLDALRIDYQKSSDGIYCRRYLWLSPQAQRRDHLAGLVLRPSHVSIVDPAHRHPVLSAMYLAKNFIVPEYARKMTALEHVARAGFNGSDTRFMLAHVQNIIRGAPRLALFAADWARRRTFARRKLPSVVLRDPREIYPIDINAEQEPNPESRITLGNETDALGLPRIRIDWRTTRADYERVLAGMRLIRDGLAAKGSARIDMSEDDIARFMERPVPVGGHHIGTTRMADSPANGVCDTRCELFETKGLFIAGAAAFPTSGFANPTLTLMALSLRLAHHLRDRKAA